MLVVIGLGAGAGLALGAGSSSSSSSRSSPRAARVEPVSAGQANVDAQILAEIRALRDEAEALTPAQVALDERAQELWMPRVASIERARDDPATPAILRRELDATISALECVGLLASTQARSCATIRR